ncbi:RHS repeat-associated core domain-containing protein [Sphingobacterium sp. DN00404]|uniref:RHS repeat-associated core domain-containing protein n=1 Tax=Sphingobacterium micropteri TaxID=2763501 RepID=A0ABR7YN04_9SPHI|nr:RHS repeat-associated core domain-containing protein [Sphingobacterium micropteri]
MSDYSQHSFSGQQGNIKMLQRTNGSGVQIANYTYNYTTNSNRLANITNYASYSYDAIGQLASEVKGSQGRYLDYDASGKVTAIYSDAAHTQRILSFAYDEDGNRIKKQDHLQNVITWYVDGNVYNGSQLIEQPIPYGQYYRTGNVYRYQLTDHVGSVRAIINRNKLSNGNADIIYYADYYPFGSIIQSAGVSSRYGYQGEYSEKDGETGWNNFYLRNYDPAIGRWLSTDPYGQYWSPYVGMGNNPVMRFDPDGGWDGGGLWGWLKGVFGKSYPAGHEKNPIAIDEVVVTAYKMPSWQDVEQNRATISASLPLFNLTSQSHRQSMYNYQEMLANANYNDMSHPATALAIGQNVANFAGGEVVLARSLSALKMAEGGYSTIYRAVSQAELDDIAKFGLRTKSGGYELGKLFAPTLKEATQFGKYNFGLDGIPNTIIKVRVPNSILNGAKKFGADGMNAISIPANQLHLLKAKPLNYSPW